MGLATSIGRLASRCFTFYIGVMNIELSALEERAEAEENMAEALRRGRL